MPALSPAFDTSDAETKAWLLANYDNVMGFSNLVRPASRAAAHAEPQAGPPKFLGALLVGDHQAAAGHGSERGGGALGG